MLRCFCCLYSFFTLFTDRSTTKAKVIIWIFTGSMHLLTLATSFLYCLWWSLTCRTFSFSQFPTEQRANIRLAIWGGGVSGFISICASTYFRGGVYKYVSGCWVKDSAACCQSHFLLFSSRCLTPDMWWRDRQDRDTSSWTGKLSWSPRPGDLPCRPRLLPPSSLLLMTTKKIIGWYCRSSCKFHMYALQQIQTCFCRAQPALTAASG